MAEALPWKSLHPTVLFVNPGSQGDTRQDTLRGYLSLGTLASALRDKAFLRRFAHRTGKEACLFQNDEDYPAFDVRVLNLSRRPQDLTTGEYLQQYMTQNTIDPLMVCTTATSARISEAEDVAIAARRLSPRALRVIGGPHVSATPIEFLRHSEYQVACIGEGVETLTEIALASMTPMDGDLSGITGIAYRNGKGSVRLSSPRKPLFAIDDYPFPSDSLDLFLEDARGLGKNDTDIAYILVGAGCPYRCVFCAQHSIHGGKVRERSARNIFGEIRKLHARGFRRFALVQETFLSRRERVLDFCRLIEKSGLTFQWTLEARADQLDIALLKRMKDTGLHFIQIGVETGDHDLLDHLGKGITLEQVIRLRDWCEELRIDTAFYILVGLPGQDWQSILRSALFLKNHLPYNRATMHVPVSIAIPYPGTRIAREGSVRLAGADDENLNWPDRNPRVTVDDEGAFQGEGPTETDDMTSEEILEAFTYLDDFGHFLLHERYDHSFSTVEKAKARDFSRRILTMLERRTIRDLILRAQENLTPPKRRMAYEEMLATDGGKERLLKDVTGSSFRHSRTFTDFVAEVKFTSGFHTMKCLSIPNRLKWMKCCAVLWGREARQWNRLGIGNDDERDGRGLEVLLEKLDVQALDNALDDLDRKTAPGSSPEENTIYDLLGGKLERRAGSKHLDNL